MSQYTHVSQMIDQLTTERDTLRSALDEANIQIAQMEEEHQTTNQERDELRAQVAMLYNTLQSTHEDYLENGFISDRQAQDMSKTLATFPADAAQYVRGLEDALQSWATAYESGTTFENETILRRLMRQTKEALAAKGDRG